MEQRLRFGLVLGRMALLKIKFWADYEQLLRAVFSCFHRQKNLIFFKTLESIVGTKKLLKMKVKKVNFFF